MRYEIIQRSGKGYEKIRLKPKTDSDRITDLKNDQPLNYLGMDRGKGRVQLKTHGFELVER